MRQLLLLIAVPAALTLLSFSAAAAAPVGNAAPAAPHAPRIKIKDSTSTNWSGYALESSLSSPQAGAVTDVKGQWTVPTVTGSGNDYSALWVGIDGYSDGTVEQIGTEQDLSSGSPVYYAWFEMYPKFAYEILSVPISAGDHISAEVNYIGSNNFVLSITDLTTNQSFSITEKSATAQRSSAEWVMEAPSSSGGLLTLADYGAATFTGASETLNGHTGGINDPSWQFDPMTMVSQGQIVESTPSATSTDGSSFEVSWEDSACARPQLDLQLQQVYWASLPDYNAGRLSAAYAVANASSQPAVNVQLTGDTNTNGVTLLTALPVAYGQIAASPLYGDAVDQTLIYHIPAGVTGWRTSFSASAKDACGASYTYP